MGNWGTRKLGCRISENQEIKMKDTRAAGYQGKAVKKELLALMS